MTVIWIEEYERKTMHAHHAERIVILEMFVRDGDTSLKKNN